MKKRNLFGAALLASALIAPASAQMLGGTAATPGNVGGPSSPGPIGDGATTLPPTANANGRLDRGINTAPAIPPANNVARNAQDHANGAVGNPDTRAGAAADNAINDPARNRTGYNASPDMNGPGMRSPNASANASAGATSEEEATRQLNRQQASISAGGAASIQQ